MSCIRTPKVDLTTLDCLDQCKQIYNAYIRMLSGGQKTTVRHGDFWVEYRANLASDMEKLRDLYTTLRLQCPEALETLPDISASARVRRGGPSTLRING